MEIGVMVKDTFRDNETFPGVRFHTEADSRSLSSGSRLPYADRGEGACMVHRIAKLDVPGRLAGTVPGWAAKAACAILGIGLAVVLRAVVDLVIPGVAPYAFIYPAALLATLLGGWQAGAATLLGSGLLAWMFVVPHAAQSGAPMNYRLAAAAIAGLTAILMIIVAEGFRAAARRVGDERNAKLAERELLFRELQHRVGNDFAIVGSLLDLQRRRTDNDETREALAQAMGRIRSIARVHRQIYALPDAKQVDLRLYLEDLCQGLREATLPPAGVQLSCECDQAYMPRDRAIAIGLVTNELVTNAVKHAFADGQDGAIDVRFSLSPDGWRLTVADNGVGMPDVRRPGLGSGLIEQFVRQAGGTLTVANAGGTTATILLSKTAASKTD
jgi:two-component sensor histidine kinase